jgi:hypothetical protein
MLLPESKGVDVSLSAWIRHDLFVHESPGNFRAFSFMPRYRSCGLVIDRFRLTKVLLSAGRHAIFPINCTFPDKIVWPG